MISNFNTNPKQSYQKRVLLFYKSRTYIWSMIWFIYSFLSRYWNSPCFVPSLDSSQELIQCAINEIIRTLTKSRQNLKTGYLMLFTCLLITLIIWIINPSNGSFKSPSSTTWTKGFVSFIFSGKYPALPLP